MKPARLQDRVGGVARLRLAVEIEAVELLAVEMRQPRREAVAGFGLELDLDRPVFARLERLDLGFALADQAQRDRLHAARRAAARQFAPQHRRQREPDQIIERAARQIGLDQLGVDLARVAEGVEHRVARHRVEHDALDVDILQRAALLQHLAHMPRDRLALAVGVGREKQLVGAAHRLGDRPSGAFRSGRRPPTTSRNRRRAGPSRPSPAGRGHGRSWRRPCSRAPDTC